MPRVGNQTNAIFGNVNIRTKTLTIYSVTRIQSVTNQNSVRILVAPVRFAGRSLYRLQKPGFNIAYIYIYIYIYIYCYFKPYIHTYNDIIIRPTELRDKH